MKQLSALFLVALAVIVLVPYYFPFPRGLSQTPHLSLIPAPPVASGSGTLVTRIVDGDTIELENGQKVRYIGIDTPETVDPRKPVQCFGEEAKTKNEQLVLGKTVRMVKDVSETDKYGRLLRYVYVDDIFVNDYLVREGFARAATFPPDVKFADQFLTAEREARDNNRGLWNSCPLAR